MTAFRRSHEHLHPIERFTRVDADMLNYEVKIEDPTTWTRGWTVSVDLAKQSDKANLIFETSCHEGNYALTGIVASTRATEKAFAEGRGPDPHKLRINRVGSVDPETGKLTGLDGSKANDRCDALRASDNGGLRSPKRSAPTVLWDKEGS